LSNDLPGTPGKIPKSIGAGNLSKGLSFLSNLKLNYENGYQLNEECAALRRTPPLIFSALHGKPENYGLITDLVDSGTLH
jgi:hypothetical protein